MIECSEVPRRDEYGQRLRYVGIRWRRTGMLNLRMDPVLPQREEMNL